MSVPGTTRLCTDVRDHGEYWGITGRDSGLIFPLSGNVGNQALGKCNFLDFTRHVSQVNDETVHLCHPRKWILLSQAGKHPSQIKWSDCKRLLDHSRLIVDSAFANSECSAEVCRRHVRRRRSVREKVNPSKN